MKITSLVTLVVAGESRAPGDQIEIADDEARSLIARGFAAQVEESPDDLASLRAQLEQSSGQLESLIAAETEHAQLLAAEVVGDGSGEALPPVANVERAAPAKKRR